MHILFGYNFAFIEGIIQDFFFFLYDFLLGGGYHSGYASPAVVGGYSGYGGGYGVSKVVAAPAYGAYGAAPAYGAYGAAPAYGAYGAGIFIISTQISLKMWCGKIIAKKWYH